VERSLGAPVTRATVLTPQTYIRWGGDADDDMQCWNAPIAPTCVDYLTDLAIAFSHTSLLCCAIEDTKPSTISWFPSDLAMTSSFQVAFAEGRCCDQVAVMGRATVDRATG